MKPINRNVVPVNDVRAAWRRGSMRSLVKKLHLIAAAAVAMILLPITAGTAHADAETAYNQRRQRLVAQPESWMPLSTVSREIRLTGDTYGWWTFPSNEFCETYTGHILPGVYSWTDELWPGTPAKGVYRHDSYLTAPGASYKITCYFAVAVDGDYTWGSGLDPHF